MLKLPKELPIDHVFYGTVQNSNQSGHFMTFFNNVKGLLSLPEQSYKIGQTVPVFVHYVTKMSKMGLGLTQRTAVYLEKGTGEIGSSSLCKVQKLPTFWMLDSKQGKWVLEPKMDSDFNWGDKLMQGLQDSKKPYKYLQMILCNE